VVTALENPAPTMKTLAPSSIRRRVATAMATTDFSQPLPPPFILQKDQRRDPEREKAINTAKQLYFNIMGKVVWDGPLGGGGGGRPGGANISLDDLDSIFPARDREARLDRDGLLDLIKTKGVRIDSVEILNFLKLPPGARSAESEEKSL